MKYFGEIEQKLFNGTQKAVPGDKKVIRAEYWISPKGKAPLLVQTTQLK